MAAQPDLGWLCFAVIVELWARRVVGYATGPHIDRHLVSRALEMLSGLRNPKRGLIHHTDRGSQYASDDYQRALDRAGFQCIMGQRVSCWDDAPAEGFVSTIKIENLREYSFASRAVAHLTVFNCIRWYKSTRRHSTGGLVSPAAFEASFLPEPTA